MLNVSRPWSIAIALLCLSLSYSAARGQALPETALQHQLSRVDLGVTAVGQITGDVAGTEQRSQTPITLKASTTVGFLATLRYVKSPLVGFEANYMQARYTENFSNIAGGVQTKASEYSLGYVVHTPSSYFGFKPFAAVGAGTTAFRPTAGGGQGLSAQARMTYYYNVGLDDDALFSKHFGVRVHLRQAFYKAPDFGQNYLTIQKRTSTLEPGIGFYLRF
ncbi:MAG: hypothetical protein JWM43_237 [Acidobacteriaceae bacterium]|nr:hypothetical protein [Acidobacteriaceae bacterium]